MTLISRQLVMPYTAAQMYALVNDVASYPAFVPWCEQAIVHHADPHSMEASLILAWRGVRSQFTTHNKLLENQSITMNLTQGLVKDLTGQWRFIPSQQGCQVTLSVQVTFKNPFTSLIFSRVAEEVVDRVTKAFCERAKVLYG